MNEDIVVKYIEEPWQAPAQLKPLVDEYNRRRKIVDECESYPRSIDREMDQLFDAMVVMA